MCTSGARLQLAIAPAGAGKTTAMRALAAAWTEDGGQVLGLAPSAAAAAVLARADRSAPTPSPNSPGPAARRPAGLGGAIGPSTLVIIDEAGMADTLTLDAAVQFAIDRGASVRLIGDDQQLAAIGAGGILRDITTTHGALQLTELHRFTDPAEAAASLALRDGAPTALGFYLDHDRVHVGDLATTTEDAFTAWVSDRAVGLDAFMLAPTRELVAELNRRARDSPPRPRPSRDAEVHLADGNQASVGDVIITRANDRRLRLSATDWVKNGDRWTITARQPTRRPDRAAHPQPAAPSGCPPTTSRPRPASATPPPSTPPKASPPTPCTAWSPGRNPGSSCTRCSPAAGTPTTSTSKSSATATPTA